MATLFQKTNSARLTGAAAESNAMLRANPSRYDTSRHRPPISLHLRDVRPIHLLQFPLQFILHVTGNRFLQPIQILQLLRVIH
jgi:hypothetical protein